MRKNIGPDQGRITGNNGNQYIDLAEDYYVPARGETLEPRVKKRKASNDEYEFNSFT